MKTDKVECEKDERKQKIYTVIFRVLKKSQYKPLSGSSYIDWHPAFFLS